MAESREAKRLDSYPAGANPAPGASTPNDYTAVRKAFPEADVIELFGDTGVGKTTFCWKVAVDALASGARVHYRDTERNLTRAQRDALGDAYNYNPVYKDLSAWVHRLPEEARRDPKGTPELIVVDSIGWPVLARFGRMDLRDRGGALLDMIGLFGSLKEWAYIRNGLALVTNQPISELAESQGKPHRPFGDKAQYGAKEILEPFVINATQDATVVHIKAHRSRQLGKGTLVVAMNINDQGVAMEWA